jgi:hypothetical protein
MRAANLAPARKRRSILFAGREQVNSDRFVFISVPLS